jgi:hypothetical protein
MKTLTAIAALLIASPALASDLTPLPLPQSRSFACYVGAGVTGAFVHDSESITTLLALNNGTADWGAEPNVGCDLLFRWGVIGVQGDYAFSGSKWTSNLLGTPISLPFGDEYHVNARLGAYTNADHHTLLYVMGGWAATTGSRTMMVGPVALPFGGSSGYDIGGGIETNLASIGNTMLKGYVEYKHDFLDQQTAMIVKTPLTLNTEVDRVTVGLRVQF